MANFWWIDSGMAAQAARDLVWFVVLVFVGIGALWWHDCRKEDRENKAAQSGKVQRRK